MRKRLTKIIDPARNERLDARVARVKKAVVTPSVVKEALRQATSRAAITRVLDANDLFHINWLEIGVQRARCVGRIGGVNPGTGVLVSPSLLLTNNHVIPTAHVATRSRVYFNDERDVHGLNKPVAEFPFEPARFFLTDVSLDFTIVALPTDVATSFGWCQLIREQGKTRLGERVTIIQYPSRSGGKKQIAFRSNRVTQILRDVIRYETDTESGSSGSPVFNDQWELIALHHHSVAREDIKGHDLRLDGTRARADTPEDQIDWIANEGIRVSRILEAIQKASVGTESAALRGELLRDASLARR